MNIKTEKITLEVGPPNCKILKGKKVCVLRGGYEDSGKEVFALSVQGLLLPRHFHQ